MLSLKPSKAAAADAAKPDLEAVQRQVSAQQALSREISEPAVIEAASDDQLKRTALDDASATSQLAAGLLTVPEDDTGVASGIVKQPSGMTKRFGFFSSLRRGSTAAEGSSALAAHMPESAQALHQQPEPAMNAFPGQSQDAVGAVPQQPEEEEVCVPEASLQASDSTHFSAEQVAATPIHLPPVFEYGSDAEEEEFRDIAAAPTPAPSCSHSRSQPLPLPLPAAPTTAATQVKGICQYSTLHLFTVTVLCERCSVCSMWHSSRVHQ